MPVAANDLFALVPMVGRAGLPLAAGEGLSPLWIAIGVGAVVVVAAIALYNQLVAMTVRADNAWSDIDVQLKRRHDLVPNVVEAVKGYAGYEKETLEASMSNQSQTVNLDNYNFTAATDDERLFWPFEGEYWRDELGTYQYTLTKGCRPPSETTITGE